VGLEEERGVDQEKFYKGMMTGVRTVPAPQLSEAAIEAARARRRASAGPGDRQLAGEGLASAVVPKNHPWASSKPPLTAEEEAAKREAVLAANRGSRRARGGEDLE